MYYQEFLKGQLSDLYFLFYYRCIIRSSSRIHYRTSTFCSIIDVLSGVPQGSIIGPLLFFLFINDIYKSLNSSTNVALYADDTKMWQQINSHRDCEILQKDINSLNEWCTQNKMKFHPEKCKVLNVSNNETPMFIDELTFTTTFYKIGQDIIDYTDSQKD